MKSNLKTQLIQLGLILALLFVGVLMSQKQAFLLHRASAQNSSGEAFVANDETGFVPCGNTADNPCTFTHLFAAMIAIINYLIATAGFIAVAVIAYSGIKIIWARGNPAEMTAAKGRLSGAVIGVILVSVAFILVNAIFSGSFSLGVKDGYLILINPIDYINKAVPNQNLPKENPPPNSQQSTPPSGQTAQNIPQLPESTAMADGDGIALSTQSTSPEVSVCPSNASAFESSLKYLSKFFKIAQAQQFPVIAQAKRPCFYNYYNDNALNDFSYVFRQDDYPNLSYGNCPNQNAADGTIAKAGCGVVSTTMVVKSIYEKKGGKNNLSPGWSDLSSSQARDVEWWSRVFVGNKYRVCGDGSKWDAPSIILRSVFNNVETYYQDFGLLMGRKWSETRHLDKNNEWINAIKQSFTRFLGNPNGYLIAVVGKKSPWTMKGHFVVAYDYLPNYQNSGLDYVKIADPYRKTNVTLVESETFAESMKAANWIMVR